MKQAILLFLFFILHGLQSMAQTPEQKLAAAGFTLSSPTPPSANFVRAVRVGQFVFLSGHGPTKSNGELMKGKLGENTTIEQGQEAAKWTGVNLLSTLKAEIGELSRVKRLVKVLGMVNATPNFTDHPKVINGFSDLMVEVFGEKGRHARSAVGMNSLPSGMMVEIEMIVEIE